MNYGGGTVDAEQLRALRVLREHFGADQVEVLYVVEHGPAEDAKK